MPTSTSHRRRPATDEEFLATIRWTADAPKRLVRCAREGRVAEFVIASRAWLEPAAARYRRHAGAAVIFAATRLCDESLSRGSNLLRLLRDYRDPSVSGAGRFGLGRELGRWCRTIPPEGITDPVELALILDTLVDPPIDLQVEHWCRLFCVAVSFQGDSGGSATRGQQPAEAVLIRGLIPIAAGAVLGLVHSRAQAAARARTWIAQELLAATDTDGTPRSGAVADFDSWFAMLTAAALWGRCVRDRVFRKEARDRFKLVVRRAAELTRGDGGFAFSSAAAAAVLLPGAARAAGLSKKSVAGRFCRTFESRAGAVRKGKRGKPAAAETSGHSEWAQCAHLRNRLTADADLIALLSDSPEMRLEIACLGSPLISGRWEVSGRVGGRRIRPAGSWGCACWYSDKDGDYIELSADAAGVAVERQIFLSRTDHFAVLVDAFRSDRNSTIEYTWRLPLGEQVMARPDLVTREWRLQAGLVPVRVFPVSLACDRIDSAAGSCEVVDGELRYAASGRRAMSSALVIDWHPDRRDRDADWARLTVTESRRVLTADEASAFRLRIGAHQLLCYRSLDDSTSLRAVLGQHISHESFIGRLDEPGVMDPLVLVDRESG